MEIKWNPNLERDLKREVVSNLGPKYAAVVRRVKCPDHPLKHMTVKQDGTSGWRVHACCEKGKALALEAIRKVNR
jgi:hypothetical protein